MHKLKFSILYKFTLTFVLLLSHGEHAQASDAETVEALQKTQSVLNNSKDRNDFIKNNGKAKDADDFALKAAGGDANKKNEIYNISSEVFAELVKANNGDMAKVQQQLMEALKNPEGFANSLSPELRKKIRSVSGEPSSKKSAP